MDSLYLVMPAYNEEKNIEKTVRDWYGILDGKDEASRMVIADSGSTDRTHEILIALQKEFPKLLIISDTKKEHGAKLMALYDMAVKNRIDYVFQTDSDGQTDPAEFNSFWRRRKRYDGIFGHRKVRGDGRIRGFIEKIVCALIRVYFKVKLPDANAPFRLMRVSVLEKYLYLMDMDYELPNIMLTAFFACNKEKMAFGVISFKSRCAGGSSINIKRLVKLGFKGMKDFGRFRRMMKNNKV
ncbi:Glycosyltransferase involved in cell wall bisynthesis [Eubacterium ruminantium]|nr:Glycosyltransferase involved in cell wall bisynthesis [Eubacterium ruminantium]